MMKSFKDFRDGEWLDNVVLDYIYNFKFSLSVASELVLGKDGNCSVHHFM